MGGWGLNITVEANSKDEAIEYAKKRAEEMSAPLDLSIEEYWIEGEDNGDNCVINLLDVLLIKDSLVFHDNGNESETLIQPQHKEDSYIVQFWGQLWGHIKKQILQHPIKSNKL